MNSNCSNLLNLRNLQEQVKKGFCYQKPFTVRTNSSCELKSFANSQPPASNFKSFFRSLEFFFSQEVRTILVARYHSYSYTGQKCGVEKFTFTTKVFKWLDNSDKSIVQDIFVLLYKIQSVFNRFWAIMAMINRVNLRFEV